MSKKKQITMTSIKVDLFTLIDEHAYLPDHLKAQTKILASRQFSIISEMIGTMELAWRRGLHQGREESDE